MPRGKRPVGDEPASGASLRRLVAAVGAGLEAIRLVERPDGVGSDRPNPVITDVTHDSREVTAGALYACVVGSSADGHDFAAAAVDAGASALLVERELVGPSEASVPQVVVPDTRRAMGRFAAEVWGRPSRDLDVVGVTGTAGKTTVTHLLASILRRSGRRTSILGTLSGRRTTPESTDLHRILARERDLGTEALVTEVSSHALTLHRVEGVRFAAALFTNLGSDHLDFHGDVESYFAAKRSLFDSRRVGFGVVNRDDPYGRRLLAEGGSSGDLPMIEFGLDDVTGLVMGASGSAFDWRGRHIELPIPGRFNVSNAVAAATLAAEMGSDLDDIVGGLASVEPVRGRVERVVPPGSATGTPVDIDVLVDYAHKPEALAAVLDMAREVARGGVVVVIGCGGDRDRGKRPVMAAMAEARADRVVLTSDNPRSEDPLDILAEMRSGLVGRGNVVTIADRAEAIRTAILTAEPSDLVIIAGKGHETTQTTGNTVVEFDDRAHSAAALAERMGGTDS